MKIEESWAWRCWRRWSHRERDIQNFPDIYVSTYIISYSFVLFGSWDAETIFTLFYVKNSFFFFPPTLIIMTRIVFELSPTDIIGIGYPICKLL